MRYARFLAAAIALTLLGAGSASADQNVSSNWSGYVVHRHGVKFARVVATWQQPRPKCRRGRRSYSAAWVGLGGFSFTSRALEQVGTEVDCTRSGRASSSAWFELIPAPSQAVRLPVRPGDEVAAGVTVAGHQVTLALFDLTRHTRWQRTLHAQFIDIGSAEWILEAPSICPGYNRCNALPLANFGSVSFGQAKAQSTSGHSGTVSDPIWNRTKILLRPRGRRYLGLRGGGTPAGGANPSRLSPDGGSFTVSFRKAR